MFYEIGVLKKFAKFTGKITLFNKVAALWPGTGDSGTGAFPYFFEVF